MLAIKNEMQYRFFDVNDYDRLEKVALTVYLESADDAGYMLDFPDFWTAPLSEEMIYNFEDCYVEEIIYRQATKGDLSGAIDVDDAKKALVDEEFYEEVFGMIKDCLSYNGSFSMPQGLEKDYISDVFSILDANNMFRIETVRAEEVDEEGIITIGDLFFKASHSPLQEVW